MSNVTILATSLLKDVPLKKTQDEAPAGFEADETNQAEATAI